VSDIIRPLHGETLIRTQHLTVGYYRTPIVSGLNFSIHAGDCWCVVGRNGCGKSTLLSTLMGLLAPLTGSLWLHPALRQGRAIGYVPQRCDLRQHVPTTVREFVSLGLVGTPVADPATALTRALAEVGLGDRAMTSYSTLSGGQRQRALIARALIREPAFLVVDEPTTGLDLSAQTALADVLGHLSRSKGLGVVLVTHDFALATRLGTHALLIHDGTAIAGLRQEVMMAEKLYAAFGVTPVVP
jgi:zinc transport system ATP-binding protein